MNQSLNDALAGIAISCNFSYRVVSEPFPKWDMFEEWNSCNWEDNLESGKSYLCGAEMPMAQFLKTHTKRMTEWQKLAYALVKEHPGIRVELRNSTKIWKVCVRHDYVEFALPHQDYGGENHYISNNGKTMIHVNED